MLVATLWDKLVKVTRPLTAVRLAAPCNVPAPAARSAVTSVEPSLARKLPYWSSIRMTGCCAKTTPAMAVVEGWVRMVSLLAGAGLTAILAEVTAPPGSPALAKSIVMLVATKWERLVNVTNPLTAVSAVLPCKTPLPPLRLAVTTVLLSPVRKLPKLSSTRMTGCWARITPAVAVADGWICMVNRLAAAGATLKKLLSALVNPLAVALNCLLVPAESISKSVQLTTPLPAPVPMSRFVVPKSGPVPLVSVNVTVRLAGKPFVESLPNWSRLRTSGWVPNAAPAVAEPGWVVNASRLAAPASSVSAPKLVLLAVTAASVAAPVLVRLPLATGVPASGLSRTLVQVSEQVTPPLLALVTVNVIWLVVREVIATALPLATPSMLLVLAPLPAKRVIKTVGAGVLVVSKINPVGALRMMVPVPASPLAAS